MSEFPNKLEVVEKTSAMVGLTPDLSTLQTDPGFSSAVSFQDVTGFNDINILDKTRHPSVPIPLSRVGYNDAFLLRGLLRSDWGSYSVPLGEEDEDRWWSRRERRFVNISIYSSPQAVNRAQEILGRNPGEDSFLVERQPGKGKYTPGEWTEGFGDMKVLAADLTDWTIAEHDMNPGDHIQSWIATPTAYCGRIAVTANRLIATHGQDIHLPEGKRPKQVDRFVSALDDLGFFTRPIFRSIANIDGPIGDFATSPLLQLHSVVAATPDAYNTSNEYRRYVDMNGRLFRRLGVIAPGYPTRSLPEALQAIAADYAANLASMFLALGRNGPQIHESEQRSESRIRLLEAVVQRFGAYEAPKGSGLPSLN